MNIAKIGESKPDREQPKAAPKRRTKRAAANETPSKQDKPPDDTKSARRVDVVA